jgi:hypothetical protein
MYERPQLKRYGLLRELTEAGWDGTDDGYFIRIDGNLKCSLAGSNCS